MQEVLRVPPPPHLPPHRDLGLLKGELSVISEQVVMRVERYCGAQATMKGAMSKTLQQRDRDYTKVAMATMDDVMV